MSQTHVKETGERLFALIDLKFGQDAAFERAANLPPKTVNNWRRGRSASFMKMLPELSALLGVGVRELLCMEDAADEGRARLSAEEEELLTLFRATGKLPDRGRAALTETIRNTIDLYLSARGLDKK